MDFKTKKEPGKKNTELFPIWTISLFNRHRGPLR